MFNQREPAFHFDEVVFIRSGFYSGIYGRVIDCEQDVLGCYRYRVRLAHRASPGDMPQSPIAIFHESELAKYRP